MGQKRRHITTEGFTPTANEAFAKAMREIGRSSATQKHTPKPLKGTRAAKQNKAIKDYE